MLGGHLADAAYWMEDTLFVTSTYYRPDMPGWARDFNGSGKVTRVRQEVLGPAASGRRLRDGGARRRADRGRRSGHGSHVPAPIPAADRRRGVRRGVRADRRSTTTWWLISPCAPLRRKVWGATPSRTCSASASPPTIAPATATARTATRSWTSRSGWTGRWRGCSATSTARWVSPTWSWYSPRTMALPRCPRCSSRLHPGAAARRFHPAVVDTAVNAALEARYGPAPAPGWVAHHDQPQLYLNLAALRAKRIAVDQAERVAQAAVMSVPGVHEALTATELADRQSSGRADRRGLSFFPGRSGNLYYQMAPYILVDDEPTGTGTARRGHTTSRCRSCGSGAGSCPESGRPRRRWRISPQRCPRCWG